MELSDVLDFPESYFEDDPVVTPVEELCTLPEGRGVGTTPASQAMA